MLKSTRLLTDAPIALESRGATLGDARLNKRHTSILERIAAKPNASHPRAMDSITELEAFYRFTMRVRLSS